MRNIVVGSKADATKVNATKVKQAPAMD